MMGNFVKYIKKLHCYGEFDVVVLGGGPSGVCAAIEAARLGQKVLIVEETGMLGGMATSGLVGPLMTSYDREGNECVVGGLYREIVDRLSSCCAAIPPENTDAPSIHTSFIGNYHRRVTPFDAFMLQIVLDDLVKEAGAQMLLYTRFVDCICDNGAIKSVVLSALEGLICVSAKVFIDCTGKADVAALAGVNTYKGDEESNTPQPGTLMFEVENVDDMRFSARPKRPVKAYRMPEKGRYKVNHYHVFGVDAANSESMTQSHCKARKQVLDAYNVLRNETEGFENSKITQVASVLGVRECRHIEGIYKIKVEDIENGTKFDDRIAVYGYGMDVHPRKDEEYVNFKIESAIKYYIPYTSMVAKECCNLIVAGKTISCESQAAGGLRCMPCAMAMGQAAGVAADIAVKNNVSTYMVNIAEIQKVLVEHKAIID